MISGTPTAAGGSTVTVTASVHTGQSGHSSFSWTIAGPPSASNSSLSGLSKRRPRLSFKVNAGTGAPALKSITVGLPSGLHFASSARSLARGITVMDASGKALKFTVHGHGALTISLGSTSGAVSVTIASPALAESAGLRNQVTRHKVKTLKVVLTATDASSSTSAVGLPLHV
jgi:hypothetical protein